MKNASRFMILALGLAGGAALADDSLARLMEEHRQAAPDAKGAARSAVNRAILDAVRDKEEFRACLSYLQLQGRLFEAAEAYLASLPSDAAIAARELPAVANEAAHRVCNAKTVVPTIALAPPGPPPVPDPDACKPGFTTRTEKAIKPKFPREAIKRGVEAAQVTAWIYVGKDGVPESVKIHKMEPARFQPLFDEPVRATLMQWRFEARCRFISEVTLNFALEPVN